MQGSNGKTINFGLPFNDQQQQNEKNYHVQDANRKDSNEDLNG